MWNGKTNETESLQLVKGNQGSAGIDRQSLEDFDKNLKDNLYKLWNRLSSGSYFPPPVMAVSIPKKSGGERILGIPTVSDRIAQMVIRLFIEPEIEPYFLSDSYGYRPHKSALDAVGMIRQRCWKYDWVVEFDIKGLFDNIDHHLLMKAVKKHTDNKWVILYIERWIKAPLQRADGTLTLRTKGTPQGGVISPLLSNLFLHYVFDVWLSKHHPQNPWCRYADDGVVQCETKEEAEALLAELEERFQSCQLELHPEKTKVVYCKDVSRKESHPHTMFTFLGYDFCRRSVKAKEKGNLFLGFTPGVSKAAQKAMRTKTRKTGLGSKTELSLKEIAQEYNPLLRGWIEYYGRYTPSALYPVLRHFNKTLVRWAGRKYKKLRRGRTRSAIFLQRVLERNPNLFAHWKKGMVGGFA